MEENFYEILGVSKNASKNEIGKEFRSLLHKNKDIFIDPNPVSEERKAKIIKIIDAWHTLSDPIQRKRYDDALARGVAYENPSPFNKEFNQETYGDLETFFNRVNKRMGRAVIIAAVIAAGSFYYTERIDPERKYKDPVSLAIIAAYIYLMRYYPFKKDKPKRPTSFKGFDASVKYLTGKSNPTKWHANLFKRFWREK